MMQQQEVINRHVRRQETINRQYAEHLEARQEAISQRYQRYVEALEQRLAELADENALLASEIATLSLRLQDTVDGQRPTGDEIDG